MAELVIEFPIQGATYYSERYGVYKYDEFPRGSVLEGQERRSFIAEFDKLADAQKEYPNAHWYGEGSGYADTPIQHEPPEWFDPSIAGESWDYE